MEHAVKNTLTRSTIEKSMKNAVNRHGQCGITFSLIASLLVCLTVQSVRAEDWSGWMGNERDGVYNETGVIDEIPNSGLSVKWRVPIEGGYAGPAVVGNRVFVFDYMKKSGKAFNNPGERASLQGQERLTVLDAETGKRIWQKAYECPYSISYPAGPRCTPTVASERVYTLGSEGDLKCFSVADGEEIWSRSLKNDFRAEVPIWGFAAHPLVDGDLVYTMVGGSGQGVVAFDSKSGDVRWKALDAKAGYCPPTIIESSGTRQLIVYHPEGIASLNPQDGSVYWIESISPMYEMSITRPMIDGNKMYMSGIRTESLMLQLDPSKPAAEELWRGEPKQSVYCANSTPLFVNGIIYGTDCNEGSLIAVDANDGSRLWTTFKATRPEEKRFIKHGTAFITRIGNSNRYFLMSEIGDLVMATLTREGYQEKGRFHLLEPTGEAFGRAVVWSHPAYANQTIYARNDKEIVAASIAK